MKFRVLSGLLALSVGAAAVWFSPLGAQQAIAWAVAAHMALAFALFRHEDDAISVAQFAVAGGCSLALTALLHVFAIVVSLTAFGAVPLGSLPMALLALSPLHLLAWWMVNRKPGRLGRVGKVIAGMGAAGWAGASYGSDQFSLFEDQPHSANAAPLVNIDGTPMVGAVDIHGNPFGMTGSSLDSGPAMHGSGTPDY